MLKQVERLSSSALSSREREVVALGVKGLTDAEISERLAVSVPTLRTYWLRVREKTGGVNRTHAIALYVAETMRDEAEQDPHKRLLTKVQSRSVSQWAWRPADRNVILDGGAKELFEITTDDTSLPVDRLLGCVWPPDRARIERFLYQSPELDAMTPIDFRIGGAGGFRQVVRTVNLSTHRMRKDGVTVLMATAPTRTIV